AVPGWRQCRLCVGAVAGCLRRGTARSVEYRLVCGGSSGGHRHFVAGGRLVRATTGSYAVGDSWTCGRCPSAGSGASVPAGGAGDGGPGRAALLEERVQRQPGLVLRALSHGEVPSTGPDGTALPVLVPGRYRPRDDRRRRRRRSDRAYSRDVV